jgi:ketosteroid isomerase-like protein
MAKRGVEALNAGDVDSVLPDLHPDIEFIPMRAPVQGAYRGHQGLRDFVADNSENFEEFRVVVEEVIDRGDQVIMVSELHIRGKGSGVKVTTPSAALLTYADGKLIRFEELRDRARALAAAG